MKFNLRIWVFVPLIFINWAIIQNNCAFSQSIECLGRYTIPNHNSGMQGVYAKGHLAYLACYPNGLKIINISDPSNPTLLGQLPDSLLWSNDVFVQGPYAYVTDLGYIDLAIVDISIPTQPWILGSYQGFRESHQAITIGNLCYLADCGGGFVICDVSDPQSPVVLSQYDDIDYATYAIAFSGSHAYVIEYLGAFWIFDISDPYHLVPLSHIWYAPGRYYCHEIAVFGNYAYVSNGYDSTKAVLVYNISDPANPYLAGQLDGPVACQPLLISGNLLYAAGNGLDIYDISDYFNTVIVANYDSLYDTRDIFVEGDLILAADCYRLSILRFNPTQIKNDGETKMDFQLSQNYPNPFNAQTTISYYLPAESNVTINIFDILGRKIVTLVSSHQPAGQHSITWNAEKASSGIYFYRIQAGSYSDTKRCLLLK